MFNNNGGDRQMVEGNWKCSGCGTVISKLPFAPSGDRPIYCKDCWSKNRSSSTGGSFGGGRSSGGVEGNWKCSECGTAITKLPFEPAPDRPIYCRDCWAKKRSDRF